MMDSVHVPKGAQPAGPLSLPPSLSLRLSISLPFSLPLCAKHGEAAPNIPKSHETVATWHTLQGTAERRRGARKDGEIDGAWRQGRQPQEPAL